MKTMRPCTAADLAGRGYDYWALGHVHAFEIVSRDPWIVYPGNLQGRSIRECGERGAVLVEVADGVVSDVRRVVTDSARWAEVFVEAAPHGDETGLLRAVEAEVRPHAEAAEGRLLAVRIVLTGATALHARFIADRDRLRDEVEAAAQRCAEDVWLERLRIDTTEPERPPRDDALAEIDLTSALEKSGADAAVRARVTELVSTVRDKLPGGMAEDASAALGLEFDSGGSARARARPCGWGLKSVRLLSLELEKFGAFETLRMAFRPEARLHVVYGPNEAGKSTALAAVGALLFGVPERTPYASRFPGQLRVGAEIVAADGRSLRFWRRKGRKNTLLGDSGSPLPDDALAPFLGGLSQEVFERSFGLDANRLRAGGDEMLQADGDVGASLLAAASGLRGLTELRRSLDDEADGIFAPRAGKDRRFYQALERFNASRAAIREKELRSDAWVKLNNDIEELSHELDRLRAERRSGDIERSRLNRLKRTAPLLARIREAEAELASFSDLPDFAAGVTQGLQAALDELRAAGEEADRARAEEERLGSGVGENRG